MVVSGIVIHLFLQFFLFGFIEGSARFEESSIRLCLINWYIRRTRLFLGSRELKDYESNKTKSYNDSNNRKFLHAMNVLYS